MRSKFGNIHALIPPQPVVQHTCTLILPSHESTAVTVECISRLSEPVRLALRYTTVDIHCRDRQLALRRWNLLLLCGSERSKSAVVCCRARSSHSMSTAVGTWC